MKKAGVAVMAIIIVAIIVLGSFYYFVLREDEVEIKRAPAFDFYDSVEFIQQEQPQKINITGYRGSIVVLVFNDILDPGSTDQDNITAQLVDKYPQVVFINIDAHGAEKTASTINNYKTANDYNWTFTFDDGSIAEDYDIVVFPSVVIIREDGYGTFKNEGFTTSTEFEEDLAGAVDGTADKINVGKTSGAKKAPNFTLKDIDGNEISLKDYRGKVLLLDFMSLTCVSCKQVEKILKDIVDDYDSDEFAILSIDIDPSDKADAIRDNWEEEGLSWPVIRDPGELKNKYHVVEIAKIMIIDEHGYLVYEHVGAPDKDDVKNEIEDAIAGRSSPIEVTQLPIFIFAIVAGIATFFSPCSFPMLPGFMSYYLQKDLAITAKLQKEGEDDETFNKRRKGIAMRRALGSGSVSASGIVIVFTVIGVIALAASAAINPYIPVLQPVIGIILIALGVLMLTNLQYNKIIQPFQTMYRKMAEKRKVKKDEKADGDDPGSPEDPGRRNYYAGMFTYGLGYGAAAAACTAPVFIAIVLGALVGPSMLQGAIVIFLYIISMVVLMIAVTVSIAWVGQSAVQKLSSYTEHIKKISAVILIIVGIWFINEYIHTFIIS